MIWGRLRLDGESGFTGRPEGRPAAIGIVPLAIMAALVVLVSAGGLLLHAERSVNDLTQSREARLLDRGIERRLARLNNDTAYIAIWNETYRQAMTRFDPVWWHENLGEYLHRHMGHNITLVARPQGDVIYAALDGQPVSPDRLAAFITAARPLISDVARQTARKPEPGGGPARVIDYHHRRSAIRTPSMTYLALAGNVAPEPGYRGPVDPGSPLIVVSALRMDRPFIADLGADYGLLDLRLDPSPLGAEVALPLRGLSGQPLARLLWTPLRPGQKVLVSARGTFASVGLCLLLLITLLMLRIRAVARNLAQAAVAARAADRAKSQFLANISHEIRTPLNAVLGMAQVMAGDELSPRQRERLSLIGESGQVLLGVLNDVLDLSRIEAGQLSINAAPFEIDSLVSSTVHGFAGQAQSRGLEMQIRMPPELSGWWRGDDQRIRQILSNLVSNALKFTEVGRVSVIVAPSATGLSFCVADTGPGIQPAVLAGLFGRFAQADESSTRRHGGAGLGLAISRELAELMGGRLTAESTPGQGSRFTLDLPLVRVLDQAPVLSPPPPVQPAALERPLRILAAEDNAANRRVLAALLEPLDADLTLVCDGRALVEAWDQTDPDIILADIQMPEMNGLEATRMIRSLEQARGGASVPIIALTANVMTDQIQAYRQAGMTGHVAKPIQIAALLEALSEALEAKAPPQETRAAG
jgi:signal transduction histidine kinase/ActR/RegA family two-component response regulator